MTGEAGHALVLIMLLNSLAFNDLMDLTIKENVHVNMSILK